MGHERTLATERWPVPSTSPSNRRAFRLPIPDTLRSPLQVALNVPLAVFPVCCVTFHLKSLHASAAWNEVAELQLPRSAETPVAEVERALARSRCRRMRRPRGRTRSVRFHSDDLRTSLPNPNQDTPGRQRRQKKSGRFAGWRREVYHPRLAPSCAEVRRSRRFSISVSSSAARF